MNMNHFRILQGLVILISCLWLVPSALPAEVEDREAVDQAVERALEYLQRTQQSTGAWIGEGNQRSPAITGLSIMAFLSAGHVPGEGTYCGTVAPRGGR